MDFLEILKNSSNITTQIKNNQKDKNKQKITTTPKNNDMHLNSISTYKNIKKGNFIKIIYQKNSVLNNYKGYIGEIKEYRKEQDSALIFLHAITSFRLIKFPITHFELL
jgi:hypothetical protein